MTPSLEDAVFSFLERRLLAEKIDDLPSEFKDGNHADYLLWERNVIVEVKHLVEPRVSSAQKTIDKWRAMPDWPLKLGEIGIRDLVAMHPRGSELRADLFEAVTHSVEAAFKKANRQLRETKVALDNPNALGVLVFLNQGVDILDPRVLAQKMQILLRRTKGEGRRRFESVDSAILITWAHSHARPGPEKIHPLFWASAQPLAEGEEDHSFGAFFVDQWAAFLRIPVKARQRIDTQEALDVLQFDGLCPPVVLDADPIDNSPNPNAEKKEDSQGE